MLRTSDGGALIDNSIDALEEVMRLRCDTFAVLLAFFAALVSECGWLLLWWLIYGL
jgi:hypothetical protein